MIARRGETRLAHRLALEPGEVVHRQFDRAAGPQLVQVSDEEVGLERVRVVVVEGGALLEPKVVAVAIVAVVLEHDDLLGSQALDDLPDDGRLARAGSAGDADDDRLGPARFGSAPWHAHGLTLFFTVFHARWAAWQGVHESEAYQRRRLRVR